MRAARTLPVLAILSLSLATAPAPGRAAIRELRGELASLEDGPQNPRALSRVKVRILGSGASNLTNDDGEFRIPRPSTLLPGQEVELKHDKPGYQFCSPIDGEQILPADPNKVVILRILPAGSPLFWTHEFIEEYFKRFASDAARQPRGPQGGEDYLSAQVARLARDYGFTPEEVRREIGKWLEVARKDAGWHKQAIVALAEGKFRLAGENLRRSAEELDRQLAEQSLAAAKERELAGDSFFHQLDFAQAIQEYRIARKRLEAYREGLGELGIKAYPEYAADVQVLYLKSANVKEELGKRAAGPDSLRYLQFSIRDYEALIAETSKTATPRIWATAQNNMGNALQALGTRLGGVEGARRLAEAVAAFRRALEVHTRDDFPTDWAMTQNDLGNALFAQGERLGGIEGARRLGEAAEAYCRALEVYTRDAFPLLWAATLNNLGGTLKGLGTRLGGVEGARTLAESAEAYRRALEVYIRDAYPRDWAATQNNLGTALFAQGERLGGAEGSRTLAEAVAAFRRALEVYTRDALPQDWAMTQNNLGAALKSRGTWLDGAEGEQSLAEATAAY